MIVSKSTKNLKVAVLYAKPNIFHNQKSGGRYIKFDGKKDTKAHKATKYDNEKFKIKDEFEEYDINSKGKAVGCGTNIVM